MGSRVGAYEACLQSRLTAYTYVHTYTYASHMHIHMHMHMHHTCICICITHAYASHMHMHHIHTFRAGSPQLAQSGAVWRSAAPLSGVPSCK